MKGFLISESKSIYPKDTEHFTVCPVPLTHFSS